MTEITEDEQKAINKFLDLPSKFPSALIVLQVGDICYHVRRGVPNEHMLQFLRGYIEHDWSKEQS